MQPLLRTQRISYTEMYVNCLVNSNDYRAMGYINDLLQSLVPSMPYEENADEEDSQEKLQPEKSIHQLSQTKKKLYILWR